MTALKFDSEKPPFDLIDPGFALAMWAPRAGPPEIYPPLHEEEPDRDLWVRATQLDVADADGILVLAGEVNDRLSGVGYPAAETLAKVLDFGARKYAPGNWRKGLPRARVLAATIRHLYANEATALDEETGLPHLAHALCCLMFLWRYVVDGVDLPDDRWSK